MVSAWLVKLLSRHTWSAASRCRAVSRARGVLPRCIPECALICHEAAAEPDIIGYSGFELFAVGAPQPPWRSVDFSVCCVAASSTATFHQAAFTVRVTPASLNSNPYRQKILFRWFTCAPPVLLYCLLHDERTSLGAGDSKDCYIAFCTTSARRSALAIRRTGSTEHRPQTSPSKQSVAMPVMICAGRSHFLRRVTCLPTRRGNRPAQGAARKHQSRCDVVHPGAKQVAVSTGCKVENKAAAGGGPTNSQAKCALHNSTLAISRSRQRAHINGHRTAAE